MSVELGKSTRHDNGRRLRERLGPSSLFIWRSWVLTASRPVDSASLPQCVGLPKAGAACEGGARLGAGRGGSATWVVHTPVIWGPRRASTPAARVLDWGSLWPGPEDFKKIPQVLGNKSVGGWGECLPPLGFPLPTFCACEGFPAGAWGLGQCLAPSLKQREEEIKSSCL